jgi:hypothetical protein
VSFQHLLGEQTNKHTDLYIEQDVAKKLSTFCCQDHSQGFFSLFSEVTIFLLSSVFSLVFRGYIVFLITMRRTLLAVCITLFFGCEKTLVQDLNKCEDFCLQSCPYTQASS